MKFIFHRHDGGLCPQLTADSLKDTAMTHPNNELPTLQIEPLRILSGIARARTPDTVVHGARFGVSNGNYFQVSVFTDQKKPFRVAKTRTNGKCYGLITLTWEQCSALIQAVQFGLRLYGNSTNTALGDLELEDLRFLFSGERRGRWKCRVIDRGDGRLVLSHADLNRLSEALAAARQAYLAQVVLDRHMA